MSDIRESRRRPVGNDEVARDVEIALGLRALAPQAGVLESLVHELELQRERRRPAAVVCLVGPTGAGKSTLLNALAGREVARAGVDRPTTSIPTAYLPCDLDEEVAAGLPAADRVAYDPDTTRHWSGHVLIDAPDVNSVVEAHREAVRELVAHSDVLLVVLHHQAVVEQATVEFLDDFRDRRCIALVLNRIDELTDDARRALLAQTRDLAGRWNVATDAVFALSARRALAEGEEADGFAELIAWLEKLVADRVIAGVRRDNLRGTLARISATVAAAAPAADLFVDVIEAAGGACRGWQARVDAAVERSLAARKADLEILLAAEVGKRWRGPGGMLLRSGTWGPLGAVGAIAWRRNPLVAAAMAAGGQIADRTRDAVARHRVERARSVAPDPADMAEWLAEELQPARMAARRLSEGMLAADATALSLVAEDAVATLESGWAELTDIDLSEKADSWSLRWFRLPLDAPLYALGAHVGWRSATAYLAGDYVGVDYYVNATVVALALAATAHIIARGMVAWAARGFLARCRARLGERLGAVAIAAEQRATGPVAATAEALERLRRLRD
jgi:hypothetical protein